MPKKHYTPRLQAYLKRRERIRIISKEDLRSIGSFDSSLISRLDLGRTPIRTAPSIGSVGQRTSPSVVEIKICTIDLKDWPTPYNADRYRISEELPHHLDG